MSTNHRAKSDDVFTNPLGWCLVANVLREMPLRKDGTARPPGTHLFAPGAKLWLDPSRWGDGYERVHAVGRHRKSHRYIQAIVNRAHLEKFRARQIFDPVVERLLVGSWKGPHVEFTAASLNHALDAHVDLLHSSGLFAAVLANPNDVAARVVLADWLCERNDPRGPVINASCIDRLTPELVAVQDRLARVWLGSIANQTAIVRFTHGFVSAIAWQQGVINATNAALLARSTPLTELHLGLSATSLFGRATITRAGLEELRTLRTIVIIGALNADHAEELVQAKLPMLERIYATVPLDRDVCLVLSRRKEWSDATS